MPHESFYNFFDMIFFAILVNYVLTFFRYTIYFTHQINHPNGVLNMRYDDRITSVELDELTIYEMMMAEAEAEAAAAEADCLDPLPEYDDQDWLDKGNY